MKTSLTSKSIHAQRGSAVLLVLVLLGMMVMLMATNNGTLKQLNSQIRLIEARHVRQLQTPSTNAPSPKNNERYDRNFRAETP